MADFPNPKTVMPKWASWMENRKPQFKTHAQRGHAINSLHGHSYMFPIGIVYKWNEDKDEWEEDLVLEKPTNCQRCDRELNYKNHESAGYAHRERGHNHNIPEHQKAIICHVCYAQDKITKNGFKYLYLYEEVAIELGLPWPLPSKDELLAHWIRSTRNHGQP